MSSKKCYNKSALRKNFRKSVQRYPHQQKWDTCFIFAYSMHAPCLLRENFHGFCPQWLFIIIIIIIIPSGFLLCLLRENFHGSCPQWLLFFYFPQWIFTMSPQKEFSWTLALSGPFIFIPKGYRVSLESTFTKFSSSGFYFILNPQQFCPPRIPFDFIVVMHECVDSWASTYKWFHLLAFNLRCLRKTKSKEGYCRHPNMY